MTPIARLCGLWSRPVRSIDEIWRLAREDAEFAADEVRVYVLPGTKRGGYSAMYFKPGDWLVFDENFPFARNQLDDANGPGLRKNRVAVYAGVHEAELAGLMRHELEHAVQQRRYGDASWRIYERTLGALPRKYGNAPGSGTIYHSVPVERDANAAAAAHVIPTYGPLPETILQGEHSVLFRFPEGPLPLDSLGLRSLAFAVVHADAFRAELADHSETVEKIFEGVVDDACRRWERAADDAVVQTLANESLEAIPSEASIARSGATPGDAWHDARDRLLAAYERACNLVA
jgi:hypothetical protein